MIKCADCIEYMGGDCRYLGMFVTPDSTCPHATDTIGGEPAVSIAEEKHIQIPAVVKKEPVKRTKRKTAAIVTVYPNKDIKNIKLFAHQQKAFERYKEQNVIPLFFEMGAGKTATSLCIAKYKFEKGYIKGVIVVAPNDVHKQWYDDLVNPNPEQGKIFDYPIEVQCVGGRGGQKELYEFDTTDLFRFVSVNVDTFSTPHKWEQIVDFANLNNYMLIIDEATVIKNPDSNRSQRLLYEFNDVMRRRKTVIASKKKATSLNRAVLTGTPVTNGPIDLWAIMEFVEPNFFGRNYYSFRAYYGMFTQLSVADSNGRERVIQVLLNENTWQGIKNCEDFTEAACLFGCSEDTFLTIKHQPKFIGPYKHADELKAKLDTVATFIKTADCVDMPPINYIVRNAGMSAEQQGVYNSMRKDLLAQYNGYTATAKNKLIVSLRLQQISSGFIMGKRDWLDDLDEVDTARLDELDVMPNEAVWVGESNPKLDMLLRDVAECDKPLLILTRFTAEAAKIYELCDKAGYKTGLFTGWKVIGGVDAFKAGDIDILVANSSKIARGFNLQNSHTTLFYSNTFSMETRQQAEFRTYRIGQKHACNYIDYVASPVDEMIMSALTMKKNMLEYIRSKDLEEML